MVLSPAILRLIFARPAIRHSIPAHQVYRSRYAGIGHTMLLVLLALTFVALCVMKSTCSAKPKAAPKHRAPVAMVVVKDPESEALRARTAVENAARRVYES